MVRFQVLTAVGMKMTVFCDVMPCSLVELIIETASTSEMLVNFYQTTWLRGFYFEGKM
jgi:hypothetical protein